jgi:hypothetical protein
VSACAPRKSARCPRSTASGARAAKLQKELDETTKRADRREADHSRAVETLQAQFGDARHQAGVLQGRLDAVQATNVTLQQQLAAVRQANTREARPARAKGAAAGTTAALNQGVAGGSLWSLATFASRSICLRRVSKRSSTLFPKSGSGLTGTAASTAAQSCAVSACAARGITSRSSVERWCR